jgi:hypothetical protein
MAGSVSHRDSNRAFNQHLGPADSQILAALGRFEYLTAAQLLRLFYKASPANLTGVQRRLSRLFRAGYVERGEPERPLRGGSVAYVYCLSQQGRSIIKSLGLPLPPRFRPSEWTRHPNGFWAHRLACSDFFLAAELLGRTHPTLSLERLVLERAFRRVRSSVVITGKRRVVIPDGWLALREMAGMRSWLSPILLELDRGTERRSAWREKVRALLAWIDEPYEELLGVDAVTVAVLTTSGEQRARSLKAWTEEELTALGRTRHGDWFRIAGMVPACIPPAALFLAPTWLVPFAPARAPLLSLEVGSG